MPAARTPRLLPAVADLALAFALADLLIATAVLWVAHQPVLATAVAAAGALALAAYARDRRERWLWVLTVALVVLPVAALVALRPPEAPVQDSVLLIDAAAGRLVHGLDPYGHDYVESAALRAFWLPEIPVNPLLAHFPYPPGMILAAVPLRLAGLSVAWLWPLGLVVAAAAARAAAGRAGLVAVGLSPLLLLDGLALFNDVFFLAAGLGAWALLKRDRPLLAGVAAAAALCLKQPALVLAAPLLWLAWRRRALLPFLGGGALLALLAVGPFLLAGPSSFVRDTASYFYGSGVDSFPVRGPGLEGVLLASGAIPSRWAPFPAALVQLPALAALLVVGWRRLGGRPWLWAALVGAVLFGLGRTLAPNYVTVVGVLLSLEVASVGDPQPADAAVERPVERPPGHARVQRRA